MLSSTLSWKAKAWYGSGVIYSFVEGYNDQGNERFIRKFDPVVDQFFRRSNINRYAMEALMDISYFANVFSDALHFKSPNCVKKTASCL